jgi:hypothetical protein
MADITITCAACGRASTFSEFVSEAALVCRGCGGALQRPGAEADKPKHKVAPVAFETDDATQEQAQTDSRQARRLWAGQGPVPRGQRHATVRHHWYAWALFAALAALAAWLRYGGGLPPAALQHLGIYAVYVALALHVIVILKAFEDSVFRGILCLLIPFYSLYYILAVSDAVYLRAVVGGLLVVIGQDAAIVLNERFTHAVAFVHAWIASGGGD